MNAHVDHWKETIPSVLFLCVLTVQGCDENSNSRRGSGRNTENTSQGTPSGSKQYPNITDEKVSYVFEHIKWDSDLNATQVGLPGNLTWEYEFVVTVSNDGNRDWSGIVQGIFVTPSDSQIKDFHEPVTVLPRSKAVVKVHCQHPEKGARVVGIGLKDS